MTLMLSRPVLSRHLRLSAASVLASLFPLMATAQISDAPLTDYSCPEGRFVSTEPGAACALQDSLDRLIADFHATELINNPITAGERGDRDALRRLPDVSVEARQQAQARLEAILRRHTALQRRPAFADLSETDRMNYEILGFVLDQRQRLAPFDSSRLPFVNDSGFFNQMSYVSRQTRFATTDDYQAYAARLTKLPRFFAQNRDNMRRGMAEGYTANAGILTGVIDTVRALSEGSAQDHPLFAPFKDYPDTIAADERDRLTALGQAALETSVLPAYAELLEFLEQEYAPTARTEAGIGGTEAGRDYYRALVRDFTTLDLSPDEVHEIGLQEVARIRSEMDAVIAESGFEGSFAEFLTFLRTDPQFYAKSEEELLKHASWLAKRIDGAMPKFFGRMPRLPYGVIKVPDEIAPNYTTGRYWPGSLEAGRSGSYVVNTYNLAMRPLYNLPALTAHEGVPGHHHQIALAQELDDLPEFRKSLYVVAFGEGWGLYTEKLVAEMGLYDNPYEKFGQLTYEMWRACRLVVDTGMHWKGWTREQAESCFLENSALSESNIRTEVDRYISWPGQALGYKIGELKILELRERAENALGSDFDIRAFHDAVLEKGSLPLSLLERQIDRYIAETRTGTE